jgi:predicted HTH domain antitoxin
MKNQKRDFISEAIIEYDALSSVEQGKMLVQVLEDQPYLMGFITNVAEEFSDTQHEALVESLLILTNAFILAGVPLGMVPALLIEEIIKLKTDVDEDSIEVEEVELSDSPKVFEDFRARAVLKSDLAEAKAEVQLSFNLMLDVIITSVERVVDYEISELEKAKK